MTAETYVIAVDWGTSHLRAFLCKNLPNNTLEIVDRAHSFGVNKVENSFEDTLIECVSPWVDKYGKPPIYMTGQIGSSIGWIETPYIPCPISPEELASSCVKFNAQGYAITIIPGVSCQLSNDNYDVMRSEELQVLGWFAQDSKHIKGQHLICLPGTHTKWVLVNNGKIELFKTAMTGELYDLLTNHSILIQEKSSEFDDEAFDKGANFTLKSELGSFTHGLFSVRSKQLFEELSAKQANSYLSGLLVGSDVRAAVNAEEWNIKALGSISIIGPKHLSQCFATVLNAHDINTKQFKVVDITLLGFNSVLSQLS